MQSFEQLFYEYYHKFVKFAGSYLEDVAAAEDIVMDSFVYYWENRKNLPDISNLPAYLLTVVKHKCLNVLRAKRVDVKARENIRDYQVQLLDTSITLLEACNPQELFSSEVTEMIEVAVQNLPERTKDIFVRNRFQNQSYKEIAEELNLSVKTIEKEMTKALKMLRISLKDYIPALAIFFFL